MEHQRRCRATQVYCPERAGKPLTSPSRANFSVSATAKGLSRCGWEGSLLRFKEHRCEQPRGKRGQYKTSPPLARKAAILEEADDVGDDAACPRQATRSHRRGHCDATGYTPRKLAAWREQMQRLTDQQMQELKDSCSPGSGPTPAAASAAARRSAPRYSAA